MSITPKDNNTTNYTDYKENNSSNSNTSPTEKKVKTTALSIIGKPLQTSAPEKLNLGTPLLPKSIIN